MFGDVIKLFIIIKYVPIREVSTWKKILLKTTTPSFLQKECSLPFSLRSILITFGDVLTG